MMSMATTYPLLMMLFTDKVPFALSFLSFLDRLIDDYNPPVILFGNRQMFFTHGGGFDFG